MAFDEFGNLLASFPSGAAAPIDFRGKGILNLGALGLAEARIITSADSGVVDLLGSSHLSFESEELFVLRGFEGAGVGSPLLLLRNGGPANLIVKHDPASINVYSDRDRTLMPGDAMLLVLSGGVWSEVGSPPSAQLAEVDAGSVRVTSGQYDGGTVLDALDDINSRRADRAALVAKIASGWTPPVGWVEHAGGVSYRFIGYVTDDISDLPGWVPEGNRTPEHHGATALGVADDTTAIRAAVTAAGNAYSATGIPQVVQMDGLYRWGADYTTDASGWRHYVHVPDGVTIRGIGKLLSNVVYAQRAVGFVPRGDDITIEGLTFEDEATSASNYIVPVGCGTAYDSGLQSGRTYRNLTVRGATMRNAWLSASVQFVTADDGTIAWEKIKFIDCDSYARPGAASAGNFNVRSDPPGKIRDATMTDCRAYDGKTASSFNFVGIYGFTNTDNTSYRNDYAATEMENGCQDGVWDNIRSVDDICGVWIDDCREIIGGTVSMLTERESIDPALGGDEGRVRDAIRITYEGFASEPGYVTDAIVTGKVVGDFGSIAVTPFGAGGGGGLGRISIGIGHLKSDAVSRTYGNRLIDIDAPSGADILLHDGWLVGAASRAISANLASGATLRLHNVWTRKIGAEVSDGIVTSGGGKLIANNFDPHSATYFHTGGSELTTYKVNGIIQPDQRYFGMATIADDAAASIVLPAGLSAGNILVQRVTSSSHWGQARIVWSGSFASAATAGTNGANLDINTSQGALTGTTGVDGKSTIRVNTDGRLYIENRAGSVGTYAVTWLA